MNEVAKTKIQCKNNIIPNSKMTRFWGLIIDETLTWNQHIEYTATKLCSACYALRNLKHIVPPSTLQTLYYAYVHPIISYGIIFWGRSSKVTTHKLFILQKHIVQVLSNTRTRETCRDVFRKNGNSDIVFPIFLLINRIYCRKQTLIHPEQRRTYSYN